AALHFLNLLGGSVGFGRLIVGVTAGIIMLGLYSLALRYYLRVGRAPDLTRQLLCWLLLGAYAILSAGLITIGRAGFGLAQSLSTRYTTYTLYLPLALVYLLPLVAHTQAQQHFGAALRRSVAVLFVA